MIKSINGENKPQINQYKAIVSCSRKLNNVLSVKSESTNHVKRSLSVHFDVSSALMLQLFILSILFVSDFISYTFSLIKHTVHQFLS